MTTAQKGTHDTVKSTVDDKLWTTCKCIRGPTYMQKAAIRTVQLMEREDIENCATDEEKMERCMKWAQVNGPMVRHIINKRRNYVSTEIGDVYIDCFLGGDGKGKKKKGRGSGRKSSGNGNQPVDLTRSINLRDPAWLPTPENIIPLVMRDPKAWGYNEKLELVDEAAQKKMDSMLGFHWDKIIHKVCGQQLWCPTKRCYYNMSTGGPKPTEEEKHPDPFVTHSSEAVAVWMIENHYKRWQCRAKYNISHPEELKYKNPDGTFLEGLEDLEGRCTCPSGGRQPYGGLTKEGKTRLYELIDMIKKNREENADWIKSVEDRVRKIVCDANGRQIFDDKKKTRGKQKASHMASVDEVVEDEDCDMQNMEEW